MSVIIPIVAADGAQSTVTLPAPTVTSSGRRLLNIPAGKVMRGLVIGPQWVGATEPSPDVYLQMWVYINNSGGAPGTTGTSAGYGGLTTWWKPSLDAAATVGNCVRIIFDPILVMPPANVWTIAQYVAAAKLVLDYCATKGLYVYATNIGFERWAWDLSAAAETTLMSLFAAWAQLLATYTNIIGVDISNEACWSTSSGLDGYSSPPTGTANSGTYTQMLLNAMATVRANCSLPVSISAAINAQSQVPWDWQTAGWFPHSVPLLQNADFMDFHLYANPMVTPTMLQNYYSDPSKLGIYNYSLGKQQFHGEFGVNTSQTSANRTALVAEVGSCVSTNSFDMGALLWQEYDFNQTSTSYEWGLWPGAGQPIRTDISVPFAAFPITR